VFRVVTKKAAKKVRKITGVSEPVKTINEIGTHAKIGTGLNNSNNGKI
jgi:hypothetical protein